MKWFAKVPTADSSFNGGEVIIMILINSNSRNIISKESP